MQLQEMAELISLDEDITDSQTLSLSVDGWAEEENLNANSVTLKSKIT